MTSQERNLWYKFLKDYPVRILRQKVINDFIVDFYCSRASLVIELDGNQHFMKNGIERDKERTTLIEKHGLKVLRINNYDVDNNFEGVCNAIDIEISKRLKNTKE